LIPPTAAQARRPGLTARDRSAAQNIRTLACLASHTVTLTWVDRPVRTLEDLLHPGLRAVCVGINPSPVSVHVGHYYQGQLGQRFLDRLRRVGLLVGDSDGYEDDALFAAGVGFTDIVRRLTSCGREPYAAEFVYGRRRLECELGRCARSL
jgi:hypothetical protein